MNSCVVTEDSFISPDCRESAFDTCISTDGSFVVEIWVLQLLNSFSIIQTRQSFDSGVTWNATQNLTNPPGDGYDNAFAPHIACSSDGQILTAVWLRADSNTNEVYVQTRTSQDSGATWNGPTDIATSDNPILSEPRITVSSDGSRKQTAWVINNNASNPTVQSSYSNNVNGLAWTVPTDLSNPATVGASNVQLNMSADGASVVASWQIGAGGSSLIQVRTGTNTTSTTWNATQDLSAGANDSLELRMSSSSTLAVISTIWTNFAPGPAKVIIRTSTDGGSSFSGPITLSNVLLTSVTPDVAVSGDGSTVAAVWKEFSALSIRPCKARTSSDMGATFNAAQFISPSPGMQNETFNPRVVCSTDGQCIQASLTYDPMVVLGIIRAVLAESSDQGQNWSNQFISPLISGNTTNVTLPRVSSDCLVTIVTLQYALFSTDLVAWVRVCVVICVLGDTLVLTPNGYKDIASLESGDLIINAKQQTEPILHNVVSGKSSSFICIQKGSLGEKIPMADLYIREGHPILLSGREIDCGELLDGHFTKRVTLEKPAQIYTLCTETRTFVNMQGVMVGTWSRDAIDNFVENDAVAPRGILIKK